MNGYVKIWWKNIWYFSNTRFINYWFTYYYSKFKTTSYFKKNGKTQHGHKTTESQISFKVDPSISNWKKIEHHNAHTEPNGYGYDSTSYLEYRITNQFVEFKFTVKSSAGSWWVWPFYGKVEAITTLTWNGDYSITW